MESTSHVDQLRAAMRANGIKTTAIVPGANLQYLLGLSIHGSERLALAFVPHAGPLAMVLPALEQPRAAAEAQADIRFYTWHDAEGFERALARCAADLDLGGRLGIEYGAMRVFELRALEGVATVEAEDATHLLAGLRMVKDAAELRAMRAAVQAAELGLRAAIEAIRPGVTEREVADVWEQAMREAGSEGPSFATIVASGPNSANPHHTTSDRRLREGELIILDGGARVGGYISDITRTVALGTPSDEACRIYEIVRAANEAGRAAVQPGASGASIDAAARQVIAEAGYGDYFVHRTGHGIGIETHEPPYLHSASTEPLPVGATFTIEPGVYVAGVAGVRIEDDVVLTADGVEILTTFERELITR